jgi:hypothetical protein
MMENPQPEPVQPEPTQPESTQEQPQESQREEPPSLVSLGVVVDVAGEPLAHDNGARWHRFLISPDMARALYVALAPMFAPKS